MAAKIDLGVLQPGEQHVAVAALTKLGIINATVLFL